MTEQELQAQLLRRALQAGALQQANQQAAAFDPLAAVTQMANNPGAAAAAQSAQKSQQARFKPISMGSQGFALPASGDFVESPMYVDEKNAAREAKDAALKLSLQAKEEEAQRQREFKQQQADAQRALMLTLGQGRLDLHAQGLALRRTLAELAAGRAGVRAAEKQAAADEKKSAQDERPLRLQCRSWLRLLTKSNLPDFPPLDTSCSRYLTKRATTCLGLARTT